MIGHRDLQSSGSKESSPILVPQTTGHNDDLRGSLLCEGPEKGVRNRVPAKEVEVPRSKVREEDRKVEKRELR